MMKTVTAILIIFCAYLHVADNLKLEPLDILGDTVSNIGNTVADVAETVIPNCVFGVKSVSMVLYTRDIPYGKNVSVDEVCDDFDPTKPIYFLVHGFVSNANYTISYMLSKALIQKGSTVFSLDWSDAACTTALPLVKFAGYPSAVDNTHEIGRLMAKYVISLIDKCGVPLDNMTFIGHSLGAHVCGFASKEIQESNYGLVPLLFGADPAGPLFMLNSCEDRLCETDGKTTIVLHTSSLGINYPIGHLDLYFNHGYMQPGCFLDIACSHSRSVLYLEKVLESNCRFPGVPMSYPAVTSIGSFPSYPKPNTTDCFVMDDTIFGKNRFDKEVYYMFVKRDTLCTQDNFSCQL